MYNRCEKKNDFNREEQTMTQVQKNSELIKSDNGCDNNLEIYSKNDLNAAWEYMHIEKLLGRLSRWIHYHKEYAEANSHLEKASAILKTRLAKIENARPKKMRLFG